MYKTLIQLMDVLKIDRDKKSKPAEIVAFWEAQFPNLVTSIKGDPKKTEKHLLKNDAKTEDEVNIREFSLHIFNNHRAASLAVGVRNARNY